MPITKPEYDTKDLMINAALVCKQSGMDIHQARAIIDHVYGNLDDRDIGDAIQETHQELQRVAADQQLSI